MLIRKISSVLLAMVLVLVLAVPVMAADDDTSWVELLEFASVNDSGHYVFSVAKSGSFSLTLPQQSRIRRVDMLISVPSGEHPTKASVIGGGKSFDLTINKIGSELIRVSGYVPNDIYSLLTVQFQKSSSTIAFYQILSCKISSFSMQEYQASADVNLDGATYPVNYHIDLAGVFDFHSVASYQARITVYDWEKFDELTIWGSIDSGTVDSVRATLGTSGLPFETSYFQYNDAGEWTEYVFESDPYNDNILEGGASSSVPYYGKYLYCITIDLSNVDRTYEDPLYLYMTGHYDSYYGATFNCQYVNGSVFVADTSSMAWWERITKFMNGLFDESSPESEEFQDEAEQQRDELDNMNEQLEAVTKPDVGGIQMDVGGYVDNGSSQNLTGALSALANNTLLISMMSITLTIALVGYVLYGKR